MTLEERLTLITEVGAAFEPWTGSFTFSDLVRWREKELGDRTILPPETIVHIISGNTPHAAWQTLLSGLVLGSNNRLKLPQEGLVGFEDQLPKPLRPFVETARTLPDHWIPEADALVVYGSDATIQHFRSIAPLEIPFVGHGHRVGIAIIDDANIEAAELSAKDIGDFDQHGCLSIQTLYLDNPRAFAPLLAKSLSQLPSREEMSLSEHGAISNLKHEIDYLAAQEPENYALWEGEEFLIIYDASDTLSLSPGNRVVFLKPKSTFKNEHFLSGIGLYPYTERDNLPSPRIFPLGQAQTPPFMWHHDGLPPLASLVKFQTRK